MMKMVGWVGNAPTLVRGTSALQAARDLYATNNPEKLVDRHGFAPRSPACKAGDLLTDRAAQVG